jgi:hypothetical protein
MISKSQTLVACSALFCFLCATVHAQSSGTGQLSGEVADASGAAIRAAGVTVTNEATLQMRRLDTNAHGLYSAPLLTPGLYAIEVSSPGFASIRYNHVAVDVGSAKVLNVHLSAGNRELVEVNADLATVDTAANLGSVTDRDLVENLPLAVRNYTQILGLNVGVASEVTDAGGLGRGATSYSAGSGGFSSNGASTNDNNFQMDGADVNDIQGSGYLSRGVPVPNPDAIEEFRVSTQPYDASQGRNSGANINVVTRSGTTSFHGSLFEYFRNDAMNANTYFRKTTDQPRADLKQNQFGGTLGGPIIRPSLLGFGSYQETRQSNGLDAACTSSVSLPPLTNDRSAAGIGAVFAGQQGYFQQAFGGVGPAIAADGSNINPVALAVLQLKNPDGTYLIPTPQVIVSTSGNFDSRGLSTFSKACPYIEHQGVASTDWQMTERQRLSVHGFISNSSTLETFPPPLLGGATIPSSPFQLNDRFRTVSIAHTYIARPTLLNEFRFSFNRVRIATVQDRPFTFSSIGASVPSFDNASPLLTIANASMGGNGGNFFGGLNTFVAQDAVTYSRGRHFVHLGGGITREQDNQPILSFYGSALFLRFADFILGQNAAQNGTAAVCAFVGCGAGYSDIAYAQDTPGTIKREYRILSGNIYAQDDIRFSPRLTVNLGLRFERLGDFADKLGHNTSFYPSLADHHPSAGGTYQGYVVPANYSGPVPAGVTRLSNNYGIDGDGQNTWQPRVGFAWQLPGGDRLMLRGGYGLFRSRITADAYNQSILAPPFARLRQYQGTDTTSASLTLQQPFPSFADALPSFIPYCAAGSITCTEPSALNAMARDVQPPTFHRYNFDLETRLTQALTVDLGYVGARGRHLLTQVYVDQAGLASASSPINGMTTNTLANLPFREPLPGFTVTNLSQFESIGSSLYNSLQASLRKRATRWGEFLVSYTWARDLTDVYNGTTSQHGGTILGNQGSLATNYGPDLFLRQQRVVATYLLKIPSPRGGTLRSLLGHWELAGVGVAQSGHALSITYQNQFSAYGIVNDRAQLVPNCNANGSGSAQSRLGSWFNTACFSKPAVIGDDGVATGFGNSPIGFIHGPRQTNVDASLKRAFSFREHGALEFRAESFNLFNHAQFADPDTELSSATFGQIRSTSVNPRLVQLALRLSY